MSKVRIKNKPDAAQLPKCPTGIAGLDAITNGGLPLGRPTLISGAAGCGKTMFGMEFLVRGATEFGEPGVFMAFEETSAELAENVRSLGFDLQALVKDGKLLLDHVEVERNEIDETGEYDLEGLFVRLGYAIDQIGAKRVVLDTLETLFSGLNNTAILRAELRRLFRWLKDRGVTAVITAERSEGAATRHGLEEYVSDCVIFLDHRVTEQISTRRLRIVKYRGSTHGTSEFPYLIDEGGITVMPITSSLLNHEATLERVSSGIERLDTMLGGEGYYRGSSVLISGTAGTGKTSLTAHFASATCSRGERCIYFAFEESPQQLLRNMRSIGLDLQPYIDQGLLRIESARPSLFGLEMHLSKLHKVINEFEPTAVVIDPISNFIAAGTEMETISMLVRLVDFLKSRQITAVMSTLTSGSAALEDSGVGISSVVDTWLLVRDLEMHGERNRGIYVLKSRGMAHSNQVREFIISSNGIQLTDVYLGPNGVLTGSARAAQETRDHTERATRDAANQQAKLQLERKRAALAAQIAALEAQFAAEVTETELAMGLATAHDAQLASHRRQMAQRRFADQDVSQGANSEGKERS